MVSILRAKYVFKTVFVGDPAVGKTSIITKHVMSAFRENYIPTLGANITSNDYVVGNYGVTLLIWDIAGQEIFSKVREKYYGGAKAAFVVYDVTRAETLEGAKKWVEDLKHFVPGSIPLVVVGNKIDLKRKVSKEDGEKFAKKLGATFIESSAKTGENVSEVFKEITKALVRRITKTA
nr:Rab family GTPase [Candidatus Njordarchaeum guaymaensis]